MRLFEEGRAEQYASREPEVRLPAPPSAQLSAQDVVEKMREKLAANRETVQKVQMCSPLTLRPVF